MALYEGHANRHDVLRTFSKRRQVNDVARQPVVEVLTKTPCQDHFCQIFVRGCNDVDADADMDADVDGDGDGSVPEHGPAHGILELFSIGRVPVAIVLMSLCLLFGGSGLALTFLLESWIDASWLTGVLSLVGAAFVAVVSTARVTRQVARWMPSTETYATRDEELVGQLGTAELDIHARFGVAHVHAPDGTLIKIRCRSAGERIGKGDPILVTDYDPATGVYDVESDSLSQLGS